MLRVKFERISRRISQDQVALAAQLPQPTLSGIERGRLNPTAKELEQLSGFYGVPASELLKDVAIAVSQ